MKYLKSFVSGWICMAVVFFTSCGIQQLSAVQILSQLEMAADKQSVGEHYTSEAEAGGLPSDVRGTLYGEGADEIFQMMEEYAIYLSSTAKPEEISVFRCYSATDAHRVALMCMERIELLRIALKGTEWENLVENAVVVCRGRVVVLCIVDSSRSLKKEAERLIG